MSIQGKQPLSGPPPPPPPPRPPLQGSAFPLTMLREDRSGSSVTLALVPQPRKKWEASNMQRKSLGKAQHKTNPLGLKPLVGSLPRLPHWTAQGTRPPREGTPPCPLKESPRPAHPAPSTQPRAKLRAESKAAHLTKKASNCDSSQGFQKMAQLN